MGCEVVTYNLWGWCRVNMETMCAERKIETCVSRRVLSCLRRGVYLSLSPNEEKEMWGFTWFLVTIIKGYEKRRESDRILWFKLKKRKKKIKDDIRERLFYVYKWYGVRTTVYWKDNVYKIVSVINNKKKKKKGNSNINSCL